MIQSVEINSNYSFHFKINGFHLDKIPCPNGQCKRVSFAPAIANEVAFRVAFEVAFPKAFEVAFPKAFELAFPKAFELAFPKAFEEAFPKAFGSTYG
jgi:hypothetical protein